MTLTTAMLSPVETRLLSLHRRVTEARSIVADKSRAMAAAVDEADLAQRELQQAEADLRAAIQ